MEKFTIGMAKKLGIRFHVSDKIVINGKVTELSNAHDVRAANDSCILDSCKIDILSYRKPIAVRPSEGVPLYFKQENGLVDCIKSGPEMPCSLEWKPAIMEILDAIERGDLSIN